MGFPHTEGDMMTAWRMAFRVGNKGEELWPKCQELGVAAMEYHAVDDIDLSEYPVGEPKPAWAGLASPQQASLKRLVYEMAKGDVIYVKQGKMIVAKGVVTGPYRFDKENRIRDENGRYWQHQRPIKWNAAFSPVRMQLGNQQIVALVRLTDEDVAGIEKNAPARYAGESDIEGTKTEVILLKTKRSRRLRDSAFKAADGVCCVCGRDFSKLLGGQGVRVLQVHHCEQLAARDEPSVTKVTDLAVVCANCHLLLHLDADQALSVDELRRMLVDDGFLPPE